MDPYFSPDFQGHPSAHFFFDPLYHTHLKSLSFLDVPFRYHLKCDRFRHLGLSRQMILTQQQALILVTSHHTLGMFPKSLRIDGRMQSEVLSLLLDSYEDFRIQLTYLMILTNGRCFRTVMTSFQPARLAQPDLLHDLPVHLHGLFETKLRLLDAVALRSLRSFSRIQPSLSWKSPPLPWTRRRVAFSSQ